MSCGKDAKKCTSTAQGNGAPEAMAVWAEGRGAGGHCPECGGFLTTEGVCNNPHTFSMSVAGGSILGVVDTTNTTDTVGICPDCGAELSVAPGEEDWCMECEELVTSPSADTMAVLRQLEDDDPDVRGAAAKALSRLSRKIVLPMIERMLADNNWEKRASALDVLNVINDPSTVSAIKRVVDDSNSSVRWRAARALGTIGDPIAIPALGKALNEDKDPEMRWEAARALGTIGDPAAIPALEKALGDDDSDVRWESAKALSVMGDKAAIPVLEENLKNDSSSIRSDAVWHLSNHRDESKRILPLIIQRLDDEDNDVRDFAVMSLGKIGDKAAIPALESSFETTDGDDSQLFIAEALRDINHPDTIPLLETIAMYGEYETTRRALVALEDLGKPAVPAMANVFANTGDDYWRENAEYALIRMGNLSSIPVLDRAVADKDSFIVLTANRIKIHYFAAALPTGIEDPRALDKYHHEREELAEALAAGDRIGAATEVADCVYYAVKAHYNGLIGDSERDELIDESSSAFGCSDETAYGLCVAKYALRAKPGNPKDDPKERIAVTEILDSERKNNVL